MVSGLTVFGTMVSLPPDLRRFGTNHVVYDGTCAKFRVLIAIGFIDLVRQSIALSQMLSASAWHLVHFLRSENDTGDDAKYSLISTRALQQRLADIVTGTTDEVITAVLAAAAYAVRESKARSMGLPV